WKINNLDELMGNALERVQASVAFRAEIPEGGAAARNAFRFFKPILPVYMKLFSHIIGNMAVRDPSRSTERAMASLEKALAECERAILGKSGVERIGKVRETLGSAMDLLVTSLSYASLSFIALPIAGRLTKKWLGEELDVNTLSKSPPGNVTGEMGLMIGDLADIAREYPEVAAYLESADDGTFYRELARVAGGALFKTELEKFMAKYGMRCSGEIDISNRRWREAPTMLVPSILGHIATNAPGEHLYRFARGRVEADEYVKSLLSRLGEKGGEHWKARVLARLLSIFRNTSGLRELPKYAIIRLFGVCRQAILEEARRLRNRGILRDEEDVFYLSLDELVSLLEHRFSGDAGELIASRKRAFARYVKLSPPRLITSEGEVFRGERSGMKAPEGALVGTPVSAGIAEGYVKVVLRPEEARLNKGEILVAPFTDPGWTPLFYSAKAIVVEIGGVMTHGSVIAREYGIPAVVGVEHATRILKDGQRIRVDGTNGFVEILEG
ncbi:MAG: PEP-utilizing enzyme, partial [Syntrophobacteraceae bacterium]